MLISYAKPIERRKYIVRLKHSHQPNHIHETRPDCRFYPMGIVFCSATNAVVSCFTTSQNNLKRKLAAHTEKKQKTKNASTPATIHFSMIRYVSRYNCHDTIHYITRKQEGYCYGMVYFYNKY